MQVLKWTVIALAVAVVAVAGIQAQEGKEVTLKGAITCAKCDLGVEKACTTVINVKDGADKGVYYFDAAAHKKFHKDVCKASKDGTVKGVVGEDKAKKVKTIKVSDVKYN
jgi:hypothetical protein